MIDALKKARRLALFGLNLLTASLALPAVAQSTDNPAQLRIGYQKYGTLIILKARGTLEQRLAALGVAVKWIEFPAGPQLLEGLNVGSIDFGTVGEAPPIFAQAAGADLVYVANEPPASGSEAIIVPKNSPLQTVADLKGKKVALNKGSNVHYLLVSNHQFYLATRGYAENYPRIVHAIVEELAKIDAWGKDNPQEVAAFLAPRIGLDPATVELAALRYSYGIQPIGGPVVAEQQKIADVFFDLKLIPKRISIQEAVWQPAAQGRGLARTAP